MCLWKQIQGIVWFGVILFWSFPLLPCDVASCNVAPFTFCPCPAWSSVHVTFFPCCVNPQGGQTVLPLLENIIGTISPSAAAGIRTGDPWVRSKRLYHWAMEALGILIVKSTSNQNRYLPLIHLSVITIEKCAHRGATAPRERHTDEFFALLVSIGWSKFAQASIAQLKEHQNFTHRVPGSNLLRRTFFIV